MYKIREGNEKKGIKLAFLMRLLTTCLINYT